jgi:hypothetical protein
MALAMSRAPAQRIAFRTVSQTGIRYWSSSVAPLPGFPG